MAQLWWRDRATHKPILLFSPDVQLCSQNDKTVFFWFDRAILWVTIGVMYALYLQLVGKLVVDFLSVTIKHFSLDLTAETRAYRLSVDIGVFEVNRSPQN